MKPKSANPEFQTLLDEIDNFYFGKELEGFDALHHNTASAARVEVEENEESSAHEVYAGAELTSTQGTVEGGVTLGLNLYINMMEDAIDEWIKENKNYITNKQELEDAFKEFEKTEAYKSIKPTILNCPLISSERKEWITGSCLLVPTPTDEFPVAPSLSFQNKVIVHQQRELLQKLKDGEFDKGSREEPTNDRKAFEYGLEILGGRLGTEGFTQNHCSSWSTFAWQVGNRKNVEQSERFGRKLANLFLEEDETLDVNLKDEDNMFIDAVKLFNDGKHSGLFTESSRVATKLEEKYIGIKRAGIKKLGRASLAWSIKRETTNMWKTKSEDVKDELKELEGTFSPFRKIIFSIQKAYYDRKANNAFEEERSVATAYERRYMNNDSGVLLAKQELEKFCSDKQIRNGRNAQLNKEELENYSRLIFDVSKANYDAKITLGLNEDTLVNSQNLWSKTNETISQMVLQNAANRQVAYEVNGNRSVEIKEFIENKFRGTEVEEQPIVVTHEHAADENTVEGAITVQTNEASPQQQAQALQPVIETNTNN